jgi:hypothetical protein
MNTTYPPGFSATGTSSVRGLSSFTLTGSTAVTFVERREGPLVVCNDALFYSPTNPIALTDFLDIAARDDWQSLFLMSRINKGETINPKPHSILAGMSIRKPKTYDMTFFVDPADEATSRAALSPDTRKKMWTMSDNATTRYLAKRKPISDGDTQIVYYGDEPETQDYSD